MSEHDADAAWVADLRGSMDEIMNPKPTTDGPVLLSPSLYDAAIKAGYITAESKEYICRPLLTRG